MKMMQGAFSWAWEKRSRTRAAPTPTNISTNSEPEMEKNGTPASPATARASRVLPVPGRADQEDTLGYLAPEALKPSRVLEKLDDLAQLLDRLVHTGHVLEIDLDLVLGIYLGLGAAHRHEVGTPARPAHEIEPEDAEDDEERDPEQDLQQEGYSGPCRHT